MAFELDLTDRRILEELLADGRLSVAELARRVAMSPPSVADRLRRLEAAGVITGYHAVVDPAAVGYPVAAIVRVKPATQQLPRIREMAQQIPEVVECHRVTGEDCFVLKVHVPSVSALEGILDRFLPYGQTTSSIIQSTPVPPRPIPLTAP